MSLLQKLLRTLGYSPQTRITFEVDEDILQTLEEWSRLEHRPRREIANDLLAEALQERRESQSRLQAWQHLSQREQDVTALSCLGYTYRQIAYRLNISPETVKSHMSSALRKFSVRNKQELRRKLTNWDFGEWDKPQEHKD